MGGGGDTPSHTLPGPAQRLFQGWRVITTPPFKKKNPAYATEQDIILFMYMGMGNYIVKGNKRDVYEHAISTVQA